jgi:hypothetical protein
MAPKDDKKKASTKTTRRSVIPVEDDDEEYVLCGICRRRYPDDSSADAVQWVECCICKEWCHQLCGRYTPQPSTSGGDGDGQNFSCTDCKRCVGLEKSLSDMIETKITAVREEISSLKSWTEVEITSLSDAVHHNSQQIVEIKEKGSDPAIRRQVDLINEECQRKECLLVVTVSGVPVFQDVNDINIIIKIASLLQLQFDRNDIVRCWRNKLSGESRVPLLYCKFVDLRTRNAFFHSWMRRKNIVLDMVKDGAPKTKVYVNELLVSLAFKILMRAKALVREKKLTSVYTVDGHVLVKKAGTSTGRRVKSIAELEALVSGDDGGGGQ